MTKKTAIPGIIRSAEKFPSTDGPGSIEKKRATIIRSIERFLRKEPRGPRLEQYDAEQNATMIRVLYGSATLPIFDGKPAAVIDPKADRVALWAAIIDKVKAGDFDREIEAVSAAMIENMRAAKAKKVKGRKAA